MNLSEEMTRQLDALVRMSGPEVEAVSHLLMLRLSDEPAELVSDLQDIEAHLGTILTLLADANAFLDRATHVLRPDRGELTEGDRKAQTDALTAPYRALRDKLEALANAIKTRLILGESILSYAKQFVDHGNPNPKTAQRVY